MRVRCKRVSLRGGRPAIRLLGAPGRRRAPRVRPEEMEPAGEGFADSRFTPKSGSRRADRVGVLRRVSR